MLVAEAMVAEGIEEAIADVEELAVVVVVEVAEGGAVKTAFTTEAMETVVKGMKDEVA